MKENYSIFLVDDDHDDHVFFHAALKKIQISCSLTSIYDGTELFNILLKKENHSNSTLETPDVIVLDINMPKLNGFEILQKVKSDAKLKSIPVYVLTTSQSLEETKMALDFGAKGFYTKPQDPEKLRQIIAEILITL